MPRVKGFAWRATKAQDHQTSTFLLTSLVDHQECVQVGETLEHVFDWFRHHPHEFAAVVDGTTYAGLISRGHLV